MRLKSKMQLVSNFISSYHFLAVNSTAPRQIERSLSRLSMFCRVLFATCFDQLSFPDFQGDIIKAIDMGLPIFTLAKFSVFVIWMVRYFPPSIVMLLAPSLKGAVVFRGKFE